MAKSNNIVPLILGVAAGMAFVKFFSLPKKEREEICLKIKNQTHQLLNNVESTVEKVEQHMDQLKATGENEWIDKLYILKKMFRSLYGPGKQYL